MKRASPYLNFPGSAEEAFGFYHRVFGGEAPRFLRYRDLGTTGDDAGLVAHVALKFGDEIAVMGSDVSKAAQKGHVVGTNVEIHVSPHDADEARRVFAALSEGGSVSMPLEKVAWSELFGACVDRFGVRWIVDYEGTVQFAMP